MFRYGCWTGSRQSRKGRIMIEKIFVERYRKMSNLDFEFTQGINVICGANGTCKTSLLHIVSNSFQAVTKKCEWVLDSACLDILKKVNSVSNPKIESLSKGDKLYNDPANGHKGVLYNIEYTGREPLSFRKHNSPKNSRYAVKPYYKKGTNDSLPYCPVVYLGLARLFPFGEFQNEDAVSHVREILPPDYLKEIAELYKWFTHIEISSSATQKVGDIRVRSDISTNVEGVDSNTISAGEDTLLVLLTALVSLKYYFQSIESKNEVEGIMLIDELDATLHPSYQFQILDLFRNYAKDYKIQIFFTTHSLSLIEYALKKKDNVIYLSDNVTSVHKMDDPDIYKIKMHLHNITVDDIYIGKKIPIFTEDYEARVFLNIIFDYFAETDIEFSQVRCFFYLINVNIGADNLTNIFKDTYLIRSTMRSVCILDGDQRGKRNPDSHIIILPGGASPEKMIMDYSQHLYDIDDIFWINDDIISLNYGKQTYLSRVKPDIDGIAVHLRKRQDSGESKHGVERELRKRVFQKHERFFKLIFMHWVKNPDNRAQISKFYKDLWIMFIKVAEFHGINPNVWKKPDGING